jgi:hypothetical protein
MRTPGRAREIRTEERPPLPGGTRCSTQLQSGLFKPPGWVSNSQEPAFCRKAIAGCCLEKFKHPYVPRSIGVERPLFRVDQVPSVNREARGEMSALGSSAVGLNCLSASLWRPSAYDNRTGFTGQNRLSPLPAPIMEEIQAESTNREEVRKPVRSRK